MSIDLSADINAPESRLIGTTYCLTIPRSMEIQTRMIPYVYIEVDKYGVIGIDHYRTVWFGHNIHDESMRREIIEWLIEWEYAEWRDIGPEDRELFATSKLTGEDNESL